MTKGPVLLIDADVLRYQLAYANTLSIDWDGDGDTVEIHRPEKAEAELEAAITSLVDKFKAVDFVLPLSCPASNFRKELTPTYKENRSKKSKPALWYAVDGFLHKLYGDKIITRPRLEGDDILGTLATHPAPKRAPGERIVVSIDKDLQTIPCQLYNPREPKQGVRTIAPHAANYFWMQQTLTGDVVDNYPGCPGVGIKRAQDALRPVFERTRRLDPDAALAALWRVVVSLYERKGLSEADALLQARLARILRHGDYHYRTQEITLWTP